METKEIKIECPKGYEIDKKNSTFECIKFKPIGTERTWENLKEITGYYISSFSTVTYNKFSAYNASKNTFLTKKLAKSSLALAQISQLIERYYGGMIKNEDWANNSYKYAIQRDKNSIYKVSTTSGYYHISFYKQEDRDLFLEEQQELLKQYFMID